MPDGWGWDDTLYGGSATYYSAGRLPYPPVIAEVLGRALELDGTERLLDVGCGPGSLTLLLASRVSVAIGVDADADMLAAAALTARRAGVRNVAWRRLRAEELPAGLGRFALVTFAQSFHWFDRPQVATAVHSMLDPDDGACVHVQATTHRGDTSDDLLDRPRPPHARIDALVQTYLGPVRRAGQGSLPAGTPADEDDILRRAGFTGPTRIEPHTADVVTRTADEIVASTFSLSSFGPAPVRHRSRPVRSRPPRASRGHRARWPVQRTHPRHRAGHLATVSAPPGSRQGDVVSAKHRSSRFPSKT